MRTYGRTYDIESVGWMATPVADSLVGGVFESPVARLHRSYLRSKHFHSFNVGVLALHVESTLIHHARHVHQCAHRSRSHTMLSSSRLGDDTFLSHFLGQQNLTDGVVDLVGTRMVEVLALQIELASIALAHPSCE